MKLNNSQIKIIVLLAAFLVLSGSVAGFKGLQIVGTGQQNNIVNSGFEGAKIACYGVSFSGGYTTGLNIVYQLGTNPPGLGFNYPLAYSGMNTQPNSEVYWASGSGVSNQILIHQSQGYAGIPSGQNLNYGQYAVQVVQNQLATKVESNIQLQDVDAQGAPIVTGLSDNNNALALQYWHLDSTTANGATKYTLTKQDVLLTQADFHIDIWIPPMQGTTNTVSGWQEGSWNNMELWYELYWNQWANSLGSVIANDPTVDQNLATLNAQGVNVTGATASASPFQFGGGVPISAWIQQVSIPVQGANGVTYDLLKANVASGSSVSGTTPDQAKALDNLGIDSGTLGNILATAKGISPYNQGNYIDLYTAPSDTYSLSSNANLGGSNPANSAASYVPNAQQQLPTQYFKIGVNGFGTYAKPSGGFLGLGSDWTVYYPAVAFTIHLVLALYGTHTYLWTANTQTSTGVVNGTATQNGYGNWTDQTTQVVSVNGPLKGVTDFLGSIGSFLSNPINSFIVILVILIVVLAIFAPSVLASITKAMGGKKK